MSLNPKIKKAKSNLSYPFDTSNYIVMDMKVRRDPASGRLVPKESQKPDSGFKKK